MNCYNRSYSSA